MDQNVFTCMDLTNQKYIDIMCMPVKTFLDFITWKIEIEKEKKKELDKISKDM
jgi:hypothetical protein